MKCAHIWKQIFTNSFFIRIPPIIFFNFLKNKFLFTLVIQKNINLKGIPYGISSGWMCCSPWGNKELSTAERLNWTDGIS